jgi:hypothetical protein
MHLDSPAFQTPWFDVVFSGKARSNVSASALINNQLILADWAGNLWSVDAIKGKKKQWTRKLKYPLVHGFHRANGRLLAFHKKGLVSSSIPSFS